MPKLTIVKIGGAVIEEETKLLPFLKDFAALTGPKSWCMVEEKSQPLGRENGDSRTSKRREKNYRCGYLELITGIYAGQVNKT